MPTHVCARRLFLRTSRRFGSAPVRLACIQRSLRRGPVLVCQGRRRNRPHCTIRSPVNPAHRGTAATCEPKFHHLGSGDHGHRQYKARDRLWFGKFMRSSVFVVSPERAKRDCVSPWPCQRRSHRTCHAIPTSILVVHALLLARRHREKHLLDAAIVSVVGRFLSSSTAVACWATDGEIALCFGIDVSREGCY